MTNAVFKYRSLALYSPTSSGSATPSTLPPNSRGCTFHGAIYSIPCGRGFFEA